MPNDGESHDTANHIHGDVTGNVVQAGSIGSVHLHQRDAGPVPQQLLHDIDEFTGRHGLVENLRSLVEQGLRGDSNAIVISTLTGKGGVGKTALATHVAHLLRAEFPDGQLYVDLRGVGPKDEVRNPMDVLDEFLRSLHVDGHSIPADQGPRAALFRTKIAGKRMLIMLDNAASEAQIRPLLPGLPYAVVLVTSRMSLPALEGARRLSLDVMNEVESTELLGRLVGSERIAGESEVASSIAKFCGGLPLAIRICGAKLAAQPKWSLRRLHGALQDEKRRLSTLRVGDLDVRACFGLSYQHSIAERDQRAFRRLGLIGAVTFADWVIGPLIGISHEDGEGVAERLSAAHLVEPVADTTAGLLRFRFHDLVRAYARDVANEEDTFEEQAAAVGRLVRAYVEFTAHALESYEPTGSNDVIRSNVDLQTERLMAGDPAQWFTEEVPNLVDAVELATRFAQWELTWQLCEALIPMLEISSRWTEWERVVEQGLAAARHASDSFAEAAMLRRRGDLRLYTKRHREGRDDLRESADIFRRENALGSCAAVLIRLGEAHRYLGDRDGALELMIEAKRLHAVLGDELGEAYAWSTIGGVYRTQNRWDAAIAAFLDALPVLRAHHHRRQIAITLVSLGDVYHLKCQWKEAMECFAECNRIFHELGDTMWAANTARHMGIVDAICGRRDLAQSRFDGAMAEFKRIDDGRKQALTLWSIGDLRADEGRLDDAMTAYHKALEMFDALGDLFCQALVEDSIAWAQTRHGALDTARQCIDLSLETAESMGHQLFLATARISLAQYHLRSASWLDARHVAHASLEVCRQQGSRRWEATALDIIAQASLGSGDLTGARSAWEEARRVFNEIDMPQATTVEQRLHSLNRQG